MQVADLAWLRRAKDLMDREYAAPMPYGVIDCAFRDPSGNHVRLGQELDPA